MRLKLSRKLSNRQATLPDGFEGSGLKMGSSNTGNSETQKQAGQSEDEADDVFNIPESESYLVHPKQTNNIQDPPDSDQPKIDQHQHGNENHNEYSSALAPSLTIGIVAIIIISAVVVRYMRRKKKLEMLGNAPNKQSEKEKQLVDNEPYANSSFNYGDYDTTPPPTYTILPRSTSLNTHGTFGNDQFGTINSVNSGINQFGAMNSVNSGNNQFGTINSANTVNTMQDLPPTPAPEDEEDLRGLEPPRRPYVQSPPTVHFAPIMPRSSSLGSVNLPQSASQGSVRSVNERTASPTERAASPLSHSSSHASFRPQSVTPVPRKTPSPSQLVSPPASQSQPSSPASVTFVKSPPPYAPSPPPG